jgi:cobalamin-dependent methionine synthase I
MAIDNLTIIGESINDSVPSTQKLFDANDIESLKELARTQDQLGAAYIDVNVGPRSAGFLADMVKQVQGVTSKPISIDSPDPEMVAAALEAYDADRAGGKRPILNSISPLRSEMFELGRIHPFDPILLVSERTENGTAMPNHTIDETYRTACQMRAEAVARGLRNDQIIIDPGIAPISTDSEGNIHRLMGAMKLMHDDPQFKGVHYSVGLSNFTVMLPSKRGDGSPVRSPLESAFLTRAMPLGLDMVIGSVKRKYELLPEGHDALVCLDEMLQMEGFDVLMRIQEFYA